MLGPFDLLVPPTVLTTALATLPYTLVERLLTGHASDFASWPRLKHAWFKHFWWWFGPSSKFLFSPGVTPLLSQARGIVLDIGPASGIWMSDLGKVVKANPGQITKIYGIEPNAHFHPDLIRSAKANGLEGIYEPVEAYAGELEDKGIVEKGSVDTIITVHVLCSVGKDAGKVVAELYEYLKPGGQWLVYEHVGSKNGVVKAWQALHNALWPSLLDGCDLTRDTEQTIRNVGQWETVAIGPDARDGYFEALPHCVGKLVK